MVLTPSERGRESCSGAGRARHCCCLPRTRGFVQVSPANRRVLIDLDTHQVQVKRGSCRPEGSKIKHGLAAYTAQIQMQCRTTREQEVILLDTSCDRLTLLGRNLAQVSLHFAA